MTTDRTEKTEAPARDAKPVRKVTHMTAETMRLGHGPRIDESKSLIDSGWI